MFENLLNNFVGGKGSLSPTLSADKIAELLHTNPDAIQAFEEAYSKSALTLGPSNNFFEVNSRQVSAEKPVGNHEYNSRIMEAVDDLVKKIVDELLSQTEAYVFDGNLASVRKPLALPEGSSEVTNEEVKAFPMWLRPELTGNLMKRDIAEPSYQSLLFYYKKMQDSTNPKMRQTAYEQFRVGLDILDLDELTYRIIGMNCNSMGRWLPQLVEACRGQEFFKIPATTIVKVPMTLLQLTRQEYGALSPTTLRIVDEWAHKAFALDDEKEYFIKTGTYSSKFDFRNAHVHGAKEVRELGEYLLYIHYQALCMAHFAVKPHPIYGVSTTNEWVVREFISDKENNPCIYHGLPLHTEYRVFVDCDWDEVIGISPYWEPNTMLNAFASEDNIHKKHDYVVYKAHEEALTKRYEDNKDLVISHVKDILPNLGLSGQWSLDVMQNGDEFWLIDMARAENSAFYDCVPKELRKPSREDWMPCLSSSKEE